MKFFIDTANLSHIKEANDLGILDGVTTNPSLMAREGIQGKKAVMEHYAAICELVNGPISAEVLSDNSHDMLLEAEELAEIHENIVVKVPITLDGLKVIKNLSERRIATNCTLIFTAGQALLAAKAGATYVSPFLGRLDDVSAQGIVLVEHIRHIFDSYLYDTQILAASVRSSAHITQCASAGADVVTAPLEPIIGLIKHPLTTQGLEIFKKDSVHLK